MAITITTRPPRTTSVPYIPYENVVTFQCEGVEGIQTILKRKIGNDSLHENSNDNGANVVNFSDIKKCSCWEYHVPTSQ
jgi:hypothetical protein